MTRNQTRPVHEQIVFWVIIIYALHIKVPWVRRSSLNTYIYYNNSVQVRKYKRISDDDGYWGHNHCPKRHRVGARMLMQH